MAKKRAKVKEDPPSHLTLRLFDPGMSMLHRAGLGGLACTLRYIERAYREEQISEDEIPGIPWNDNTPPWRIDKLEVTLNFGEPEHAGEFLKRLFSLAFQIRDSLVYLPGQHIDPPNKEVLIDLQSGLTLTFLQHGNVRKLEKNGTTESFHIDDTVLQFNYRKCISFKHQEGWKDLVDKKGCLQSKPIEVIGPINPGAVVRHNAFSSDTKIEESVDQVLALYFAIVGCLTLPVNRGCGVLVIPDVQDLVEFAENRPYMTPLVSRECRITNAGDAVLQAQIRLKSKKVIDWYEIPACHAITFQPTPWASQQKSRVHAMIVPPGEEERLKQFEFALSELPPRIISRTKKETTGKGKDKKIIEKTEWFWVDSIIRPLIADNLARNQSFYQGFTELMIQMDPVSKKPLREKIHFEKKGLKAMVDKTMEGAQKIFIDSVHKAMSQTYGRIKEDAQGPEKKPLTPATKKRWSNQYDRWRLAFSGAKTPEQIRFALCDLFSRAGGIEVLKKQWQEVLPMISDRENWQLTRDLALLALASYTGKEAGILESESSEELSD
ncbi:MAG: type I-MYXAN CRISPR-associated Cas8a1/Cmx1 [bacterium]